MPPRKRAPKRKAPTKTEQSDKKPKESEQIEQEHKASTIYEFTANTLNGEEISLEKYKGHVCIIVNVASRCGHTKSNYEQFVELYDKYADEKGLRILAFPCNQFGGQEPGDAEKICEFVEKRNVKFDMFEKIKVNGKDAHPLWKFLKEKIAGPKGKDIKWNFTKFVINDEGVPVERHAPAVKPLTLVESLEKLCWNCVLFEVCNQLYTRNLHFVLFLTSDNRKMCKVSRKLFGLATTLFVRNFATVAPSIKMPNPENFKEAKSIYDFSARTIDGEDVSLEKYHGHVCIIVNVASQCGYTKNNYAELVDLYNQYGESKGLRILAFPCNQFAGQEPGTNAEICQFAKSKNVNFDMFEKINVNGNDAHPLWKYLKYKQGGTLGDFIKWNFTKFIVDKDGQPVERHGPSTDPKDLVKSLEKYW